MLLLMEAIPPPMVPNDLFPLIQFSDILHWQGDTIFQSQEVSPLIYSDFLGVPGVIFQSQTKFLSLTNFIYLSFIKI